MSNNVTTVQPLAMPLSGSCTVPGDKSISHRSVLFSAMSEGVSHVSGVLDSADVRSSMAAVSAMGAKVNLEKQPDGTLAGEIEGWGAKGPSQPDHPIDCGNSGTTVRLLMGVLAPWDIEVTLTGDESLQKRPMKRITAPLEQMGVTFTPEDQKTLPLVEHGNPSLKTIDYVSPVASAQLKSAILIAGAFAEGKTTVNEPAPSRNHTELMFPLYGVDATTEPCFAAVSGPQAFTAADIVVPGDPSSAAFPACAACLLPGSNLQIENVSLNPARIGFVKVLQGIGAQVTLLETGKSGEEPVGTISVEYTDELHGCEVAARDIASMVDEIPVLSLVAATCTGETVFRDVSELRVKESDRLTAIIEGLAMLNVNAWAEGDDLHIQGNGRFDVPEGLVFDSLKDHRLAMTWSLVGLTMGIPVNIIDFESVCISFPTFMEDMRRLAR